MTDLKHFNIFEFSCPCCGKNEMDEGVLSMFDIAREIADVAFSVNSGYRCRLHNQSVGGKQTSSHIFGLAGDIAADNSRKRFLVLNGLILAGFKRIGIAKTFIHADDDKSKDPEVVWLY